MAIKGCKAKLFIDAIPLSLSVSTFTVAYNVIPINYTVLQNCTQLRLPGLGDMNVAVNGYMQTNDADDLRTKIQGALADSDNVLTWMVDTDNTAPTGGTITDAFASNFSVNTPLDNLITVQSTFQRATSSIHGRFLASEELVDATGALANYADVGVQGTTGGNALLIVSALSGTATDAEIIIESDDNSGFSSPATEGTFTFSAVGVYTISLSGTVDRYLRANVSDLGGADDFTVTILVGINGVTQ